MASSLADVLGVPRALIGMVHLLPLPGSPRWGGSMAEVVERALADARALEAGGLHALLVENHGDAPFTAGRVDAATVAAMTAVISEIRRNVRLPLGVNVLKNDAQSGLAVAAATGARFIRINVHVGAEELEQEARDCVSRGLADALVVSGKATGEATPLEDVKRVRSAVRDVPLLVGSGVTPDTVSELLSVADGAIVGTFLN